MILKKELNILMIVWIKDSNIVLLDEGFDYFKENYPQFLEGPEKEKYLKIKKEKDDKKKNEFFFDFLD